MVLTTIAFSIYIYAVFFGKYFSEFLKNSQNSLAKNKKILYNIIEKYNHK